MSECVFVSDIHGSVNRCTKLLKLLQQEKPGALFIGGDILPSAFHDRVAESTPRGDFIEDFLIPQLGELQKSLSDCYPEIFIILGNDDPATIEKKIRMGEDIGLFKYIHSLREDYNSHPVYGYSYVPPTPFLLKDWEKYDVSRHTDVGCVSPEEGFRTATVGASNPRYQTIQRDIAQLVGERDVSNAIFLFHSPPYQTNLDRADLDGKMVDHSPLDVNVGSIAIRRFIEEKQPLVTLHGHIHESARITGSWRDRIGRTHMFSAAHDGHELAVVRFRPESLDAATRELL